MPPPTDYGHGPIDLLLDEHMSVEGGGFGFDDPGLDPGLDTIEFLRVLNDADLNVLANPPAPVTQDRPILRVRFKHHQLAKMIADGEKVEVISQITGYAPQTVYQIQSKPDPALAELIAYYRDNKEEIYFNAHERLARVGGMALEELETRLETAPEDFTQKELRELMGDVFERSVAPSKGLVKGQGQGGTVVQIQFVEPPKIAGPMVDITPKGEDRG